MHRKPSHEGALCSYTPVFGWSPAKRLYTKGMRLGGGRLAALFSFLLWRILLVDHEWDLLSLALTLVGRAMDISQVSWPSEWQVPPFSAYPSSLGTCLFLCVVPWWMLENHVAVSGCHQWGRSLESRGELWRCCHGRELSLWQEPGAEPAT